MAYPSTTSFEMSKVEEIERAIQQLSSDDLSEFRAWFATFDAEVWDREFDEDVQAGRLDAWLKKPSTTGMGALHRLVNHRATPRFWSCYRRLPEAVRPS